MSAVEAKYEAALKRIASYVEKKKPLTLAMAEHMLAAVGIIASETVAEAKAASQ